MTDSPWSPELDIFQVIPPSFEYKIYSLYTFVAPNMVLGVPTAIPLKGAILENFIILISKSTLMALLISPLPMRVGPLISNEYLSVLGLYVFIPTVE